MSNALLNREDEILCRNLDQLSQQLVEAAEAGDLARMGRVDQALRNAVIAWVGSGCISGEGREQRVSQLRAALKSVEQACAKVRQSPNRANQDSPNTRGNLIYLKMDAKKR